jgi:LPS export ABC transporter protein LptC
LGGAGLAALSLLGLSNLDRFGERATKLTLSGGPIIQSPDFQGRTKTGRAYRISGETARRDGTADTLLSQPRITLAATADSDAANFRADEARLTSTADSDLAQLSGTIIGEMGDGTILKTENLDADLKTQMLSVPQSLSLNGPQLNLTAQNLNGDMSGQIYTLMKVDMRLIETGNKSAGKKETSPSSGLRFTTEPDAPLDLMAGKMRWQQKAGRADLSEAAQVKQGPMQLNAATMRIRFDAQGTAETLAAKGAVRLVNEDGQSASAKTADYNLRQERLVLRGNVVFNAVAQDGARQELTGAVLDIDMKSGQARLSGGKNRARIELAP